MLVIISILTLGPHPLAARFLNRNTHAPIASLAVLPLDNLSGDPNEEYFADGMTDELTTMLAKNSTLRIVSRTSAMQFKGAHRSLPEIARALNVDGILEGSVSRANGQVHMTLQLIRGDTDADIWAESYDRDTNNVAALPDVAARAIAARLNSATSSHASARYINPEAHDAYLRGHYDWVVGRNENAGRYYQQAVEIQPDYALGWTGLADYYAQGAMLGELDPRQALPQAETAARKAVEWTTALPRAHATLGGMIFFNRGDGAEALREISRSKNWTLTMASPSSYTRRFFARWAAMTKRSQCRNSPSPSTPLSIRRLWRQLYLCTRQFDAAISDAEMRLKDRPADPDILDVLAESYHWKGRDKECR